MSSPARAIRWALGGVALATVVAIVILWPGDDRPSLPGGLGADSEVAEVQSVTEQACPTGQPGTCADAAVQLKSGPDGVRRFHSEPASSGYRYKRTLKRAGRYKIVCTLHEEMTMRIRVRSSS